MKHSSKRRRIDACLGMNQAAVRTPAQGEKLREAGSMTLGRSGAPGATQAACIRIRLR